MSISVIVQTSKGKQEYVVENEVIVIGKSNESDITIDDPSVSREHALIERTNGLFFVTDLQSSNGTSVNGREVTSRCEISSSDKILIGRVSLRFSETTETIDKTMKLSKEYLLDTVNKPETDPIDLSTQPGLSPHPALAQPSSKPVQPPPLSPQPTQLPPMPPKLPEPPALSLPPAQPTPSVDQGVPAIQPSHGGPPPPHTDETYYLARHQQNSGPYTWSYILQMGQEGNLFAGDLLRSSQAHPSESWMEVEQIDSLKGFIVPTKGKVRSKKLMLIVAVCGIVTVGAILIFSFIRFGSGVLSTRQDSKDMGRFSSSVTASDDADAPEMERSAPPIEDKRILKVVEGSMLEVFSTVPGQIEILTESDESMGSVTGNSPQISCKVPPEQQLYKINFEPSGDALGTQRIYYHEINPQTTHIQISPDRESSNSYIFSRSLVTAKPEGSTPDTQSMDLENSDISIAELEKEFGLENNSPDPKQSPQPAAQKKPDQKKPIKKKTVAKPDKTKIVWGHYVIPLAGKWSKNREKSNKDSLTLQSNDATQMEMIVFDKNAYEIEKNEKKKYLKEMLRSFKDDPSYVKTSLDKRSRYTVLGNKKCPMITTVAEGTMKMFIFLPYHNGKFYMVIAITSDFKKRKLSPNMRNMIETISFRSGH